MGMRDEEIMGGVGRWTWRNGIVTVVVAVVNVYMIVFGVVVDGEGKHGGIGRDE
jgi:hypothetical protein